jgi:hypothetical protein
MALKPREERAFPYVFVVFFCVWWGLALLYLSSISSDTILGKILNLYSYLGIVLILIAIASGVSGALSRSERKKNALEPKVTV